MNKNLLGKIPLQFHPRVLLKEEKQNTIIKDENNGKLKSASNISVEMGTLAEATILNK